MILYKKRKLSMDTTCTLILVIAMLISICLFSLIKDKPLQEIFLILGGILVVEGGINFVLFLFDRKESKKIEKEIAIRNEVLNEKRQKVNAAMQNTILEKYNNDKYIFVEKYKDKTSSIDVLNNYVNIDTSKIKNIFPLSINIQRETNNIYLNNKDFKLVDCYRMVYNECVDGELKYKIILIYEKK